MSFDLGQELKSIHFGNVDIGKNDISTVLGVQGIEGIKPIVEHLDFAINAVCQYRDNKIPYNLVVIDNRYLYIGNDGGTSSNLKEFNFIDLPIKGDLTADVI